MGDGYDDVAGPAYGAAAGPSPAMVGSLLLLALLLILVLAIAGVAYRQGMASERRRAREHRAKSGEVIYYAIRSRLNGALLATGEGVFAPARVLLETIDLYLGPLVTLLGSFTAIQQLRKALFTCTKEVDPKHPPGHAPAAAPGGTTMIFNAPTSVAAAAGGGLTVSKPASAGDAHGAGAHGDAHAKKDKVELPLKEQARNVRDALEALNDVWIEDRVKAQVTAAQEALMISKPIGTVSERAAERAAWFARRPIAPAATPVAKAASDANKGFPLFKL